MSANDNFNSSCMTTSENSTFNGISKSYIAGDETVIKCANSISKFVLGEIIGFNLVK